MADGKPSTGTVSQDECKLFDFTLTNGGYMSYTLLTRIADQFRRHGWLHETAWIEEERLARKFKKPSDKGGEHITRTKQEKKDLVETMRHFKQPSRKEEADMRNEAAGKVDGTLLKQREVGVRKSQKKDLALLKIKKEKK